MINLVTRESKGEELTWSELDGNFTNLKNAVDNRLQEVANYAAVRNISDSTISSVYVRGVANIFDGGAGIFRVKFGDTTSADNGGTILVDAVGRRWFREFSGAVYVEWFGAKGDGVTPDDVSINATIAAFPNQGSPNWKPWILAFNPKTYKVNSAINIKNQQGSSVYGNGAKIVGDFDGTVLQIGDLTGGNDVLWTNIIGLTVIQNNTGPASCSVSAQHIYSCTIRDCFFYGGRYAFALDGNANLIQRCTFRGGIAANAIASGASNNEVNLFQECAFELSAGYGLDLQVNSGVGGGVEVLNCYFEANAIANIRAKNTSMFRIAGNYFNLQNSASGVLLDGTVGGSFPDGYGVIENNRILGHESLTPAFISEASSTSINCSYRNNQVESGNCSLYAFAPRSINLDRRKDFAYITNGDSFAGSPQPDGRLLTARYPQAQACHLMGLGQALSFP
jgi:hypothetical protein